VPEVERGVGLAATGIFLVGRLLRIEPILGRAGANGLAGAPLEGLGMAFIGTENGEVRVDLRRTERTLSGTQALQAWVAMPKLVGHEVVVRVSVTANTGNRGGAFVNIVAIEAEDRGA
jgi:hypothetical protein